MPLSMDLQYCSHFLLDCCYVLIYYCGLLLQ